eukprot:GILK01009057.1.p1 GENE.GILK01009057.1~~GILK01009057.1.p1  ORF type:complete len:262 (+),score=16.20 GILK01009057.1:94-879(+)
MEESSFKFDFEEEIQFEDVSKRGANNSRTARTARTSGRKSVVCKHWLRGLCMKGDDCEFLHQLDPERMPRCHFWDQFGECKDAECLFRHVTEEDKKECLRYKFGFCKQGLACKLRHAPSADLPEEIPDWFLAGLLVSPKIDTLFAGGHFGSRNSAHMGSTSGTGTAAPSSVPGGSRILQMMGERGHSSGSVPAPVEPPLKLQRVAETAGVHIPSRGGRQVNGGIPARASSGPGPPPALGGSRILQMMGEKGKLALLKQQRT